MGGPPHLAMPLEKPQDFRGTLKKLMAYITPHRWHLLAIFSMTIISTLFGVISPKIMGKATTKLFAGLMAKLAHVPGASVDFGYIWNIIVALAILYVVSALFSYLQQFLMAGVVQKIVFELRQDVNHKLARLPLKFFDSHSHGDILSRVTNDIDTISGTLQQSLTQLISASVTLAGVTIMMLTISPLMTLIAFLTLPLSLLVTMGIARRSQRQFARQQRSLGELNGYVEEIYTGHPVVKAFGREKKAISEFEDINERLYDAGWRAQFISGMIMPLMHLVGNLGYVLVAVTGGILVTRRAVAIGDVQAFIQYVRQFTMPITQTANIANIIQSTVAAAERVFQVLDEQEEIPDDPHAQTITNPHGEVRFERVRFSYRKDLPLIEDMEIHVRPGQTVAIVGPTGAGKTTMVNLLMRFYELDGGRITIDGVDIRELKRGDLRRLFGMVLQDTWLFHGTIRENIAYGRPDATGDEIVGAAKAARADHFIRTLPAGYDTVLNEEASNISQGQRQLLTIARAILTNPPILILDEATSSVDTRTEVYIQEAMAELRRGRTSFVIAHRLSTIREADLILVINGGRVIEQGTHKELLARGGFYADLYNSQFTNVEVHSMVG
jgi:ATP-binding cassette subfamily B protein